MIKNIDKVEIVGFSQYHLYNFAYTPGFSNSVGQVVAEFFNESGEYVYPEMDNSYVSIKINEKSIGLFTVVATEKQKSGNYKVMRVTFYDRSIELDRTFIALRGYLGYDTPSWQSLPPKEREAISNVALHSNRILWIGESDTNCEENLMDAMDGTDPCNPCSDKSDEPNYHKLSCDKYYECNERIYKYSFAELLSKISSMGIGYSGNVDIDNNFKFEYSGTVRDVLNNVCAEIGMTFIYEPYSHSIVFVDMSSGIDINLKTLESNENKCKILDSFEKISREGLQEGFGVSSFKRGCEEKSYGCGSGTCKKLKLHCLTLKDILSKPAHFAEVEGDLGIGDNTIRGFKILEFASGVSYRIGQDFRDLMIWHYLYKIKNGEDLDDFKGKKLWGINGMEIVDVFHSQSETSLEKYKVLSRIKAGEFAKEKSIANKGTYWFLAKIDTQHHQKVIDFEASVSQNFLGKWWYRAYKEHWKGLSYSFMAPDGSPTYYDYNDPISLPFADMIYEAYGNLQASPLFEKDGNDTNNISIDGKARDTFVLMERSGASWFPTEELEENQSKKINESISRFLFKEEPIANDMDFSDIDPNWGQSNSEYRLFCVEEASKDNFQIDLEILDDDSVKHPADQANENIRVEACGKLTSYGIVDARTIRYKMKVAGAEINIWMPSQSNSLEDPSSQVGSDGYIVLVDRSGADSTYQIPKAELFEYSQLPSSNLATKLDFNIFDANENDLKLLAKEGNVCILDKDKIKNLMKPIAGSMRYIQPLREEKRFTLEGLPVDNYSPIDGLTSLDINSSSSGFTTTISFSNVEAFRETPEMMLKKLRFQKVQNSRENRMPSGNFNITNSNDLPEQT